MPSAVEHFGTRLLKRDTARRDSPLLPLGHRCALLVLIVPATMSCGKQATDAEAPAAAQLRVTPCAVTIAPGSSIELNAEVKDSSGTAIPEVNVRWWSENESVASVGRTGLVTASRGGTALIVAKAGTVSDSSWFAVYTPGGGTDRELEAGHIGCESDFGVPDTVEVNECIPVMVGTVGSGCDRRSNTLTATEDSVATVTPFDWVYRGTGPCSAIQLFFLHVAAVTYTRAGPATVRVVGRNCTVDREITVRY